MTPHSDQRPPATPVWNFGRNVGFLPASVRTPASEEEVADILRKHPGEQVRAIGSLHSWNRIIGTRGIALDLSRIDHVRIEKNGGGAVARVGAGCTLEKLLRALDRDGLTLPSLGAVKQQTIAGAISTGTHGSGAQSMSSFVTAVRLVSVDSSGEPVVRSIDGGDELEAARCSLGALGILTEVTVRVVDRYVVEDSLEPASSLDEILSWEADYPLQQFILTPWSWSWNSFRRRVIPKRSPWILRSFRRVANAVFLDFGLHALLWVLVRTSGAKRLLRDILPKILPAGLVVADDSERILTMNHHWFRHVEMELFVADDQLARAVGLVRSILEIAGGELAPRDSIPGSAQVAGTWTHHYPLFFRRILNDDTMISMAAPRGDTRWWYSISLFCYTPAIEKFANVANLVAKTLVRECGARPHWGKFHRLDQVELRGLWPRFDEFRGIAQRMDPSRRFVNDYLAETLGL